ncbi:MAG: hypothetical protein ACLFM9_00335 [Candidatus Aenigmatarchaeota archaeon]
MGKTSSQDSAFIMEGPKGSLPLKFVAVIVIMLIALVVVMMIMGGVEEGADEGLGILSDTIDRFTP